MRKDLPGQQSPEVFDLEEAVDVFAGIVAGTRRELFGAANRFLKDGAFLAKLQHGRCHVRVARPSDVNAVAHVGGAVVGIRDGVGGIDQSAEVEIVRDGDAFAAILHFHQFDVPAHSDGIVLIADHQVEGGHQVFLLLVHGGKFAVQDVGFGAPDALGHFIGIFDEEAPTLHFAVAVAVAVSDLHQLGAVAGGGEIGVELVSQILAQHLLFTQYGIVDAVCHQFDVIVLGQAATFEVFFGKFQHQRRKVTHPAAEFTPYFHIDEVFVGTAVGAFVGEKGTLFIVGFTQSFQRIEVGFERDFEDFSVGVQLVEHGGRSCVRTPEKGCEWEGDDQEGRHE